MRARSGRMGSGRARSGRMGSGRMRGGQMGGGRMGVLTAKAARPDKTRVNGADVHG